MLYKPKILQLPLSICLFRLNSLIELSNLETSDCQFDSLLSVMTEHPCRYGPSTTYKFSGDFDKALAEISKAIWRAPKLLIRNCCPICGRKITRLHRINVATYVHSRCVSIASPITDAQVTPPMDDVESSFDMSFSPIADSDSKVCYYVIASFRFTIYN